MEIKLLKKIISNEKLNYKNDRVLDRMYQEHMLQFLLPFGQ